MMKNNFNTSSGVYKVKTFGTIQWPIRKSKHSRRYASIVENQLDETYVFSSLWNFGAF